MWSTTYHEPEHAPRLLTKGAFDICIIKFVQCAMLIDDGTMLGRVELRFDDSIALRHPPKAPTNPVAGVLSRPVPPINNPLLTVPSEWSGAFERAHARRNQPRGGFTPRTGPSKVDVASFKKRSQTHPG